MVRKCVNVSDLEPILIQALLLAVLGNGSQSPEEPV